VKETLGLTEEKCGLKKEIKASLSGLPSLAEITKSFLNLL